MFPLPFWLAYRACVAAMPVQSLKPKESAEAAKAMYPYNAENDEEVDLQEGDVVLVEYKASVDAKRQWPLCTLLLFATMILYL